MTTTPFLFVVTGHTDLGDTGRQTGFHFEELSTPYYILRDAGYEVVFASPAGGEVKADPGSLKPQGENADSVDRFLGDEKAMQTLKTTMRTDAVKPAEVSGIYLPGGHGTMWDLPQDAALAKLVGELDAAGSARGVHDLGEGLADGVVQQALRSDIWLARSISGDVLVQVSARGRDSYYLARNLPWSKDAWYRFPAVAEATPE